MIFGAWRDESVHESGALKVSSSEMLGLYSLFRHWVEHVLEDDRLALERDSFAKACKCLEPCCSQDSLNLGVLKASLC